MGVEDAIYSVWALALRKNAAASVAFLLPIACHCATLRCHEQHLRTSRAVNVRIWPTLWFAGHDIVQMARRRDKDTDRVKASDWLQFELAQTDL